MLCVRGAVHKPETDAAGFIAECNNDLKLATAKMPAAGRFHAKGDLTVVALGLSGICISSDGWIG